MSKTSTEQAAKAEDWANNGDERADEVLISKRWLLDLATFIREQEATKNEAIEACRALDTWDGSLGEGCVILDDARDLARVVVLKAEKEKDHE